MRRTKLLLICLLLCFGVVQAQDEVTLTATSGTLTGSFTTLKGAFDAINLGTHQGAIVISINLSTTEAASAELNASGSTNSSYTSISIYPTTTGLSISGALDGSPLINLNGADNVTIDGRVNATGSSKSLEITNTSSTSASTIQFISDATYNTVKYCTLKGSSAGIVFFSTAATTGNDNNTISNNDITCAADANRPLNAIYAGGTSGANNDNNNISNNNIYNFLNKGVASNGINISSYNSTYSISGNSFYETASFTPTAVMYYNVLLINAATGGGNEFTISGNYIGGTEPLCGGTAWTKTGSNNAFTGISVTTATGTANSIQGNTIQNINWTNNSSLNFIGIFLSGATVANIGTVSGNTIGAATGNRSIQFTAAGTNSTYTTFFGINMSNTGTVVCNNNIVGAIETNNSNQTFPIHIYPITKLTFAGTTTISNNTVGSTSTAGSITAASSSTNGNQNVIGIRVLGTGERFISGNTIANLVNSDSNTSPSSLGVTYGIIGVSGTFTVSNNIIRDLSSANANVNNVTGNSISGILMYSLANAAHTVSGNTVYNLSNSYATFAGEVRGIYFAGNTTASTVNGNFIHSLSVTGASSTSASICGIRIGGGRSTYSNNIVSLRGNTPTTIYGIFQTGIANNNNSLFFNTVYLSGSLVSGATNKSYALYSGANTNTRDFRNNVLVNARSTTGGASTHYALYILTTGGTLTCDYNNYHVSGTGGVLGYYGADVSSLPLVTGSDVNSISTSPSFGSTGTTASGYLPTVLGLAVSGTGITVDYNGNTRSSSDFMGAFSSSCITPSSGGTIAAAQSGSSPFDPAAFTNSAAASGQSGTLEYKWQLSTTNSSSGFSDIASSNAATYDAGALTQTTWFKRLARVTCSADWSGAVESNVLEVTVSSTSLWTGANSSAWNDAGNWSTNSLPTTTSEVTIAVAANQPLLATDVAIKSLTINSGATLTVPTGLNLTVSSYINNSGTMTVENNANLIQEGTTNSNIGAITVKRNSNALKRLDYTVWSSPVASQQLLAFSPATVANRFFTYNTSTNLYNVVPSPATTNFALGNGYLIRMPNTASDGIAIAYPGEFIGVPNNGSIPVTLANNGVGMRYNAVGNPYSSPISITQFVSDNSANITSSLYFWRKTNAAGGSAYCTLNNGTFITNNQAQVFDPNGIIQTGQGFFVEAKDLATSLTFNNGQRVSNTAGQFFKTKQVVENNRIWLNVTNNQGEFGQMAINYTAGATNDVDEFDAKYFNDGKTALNSVLNTIDYVIQGRALPFDATDEVTLSFKAITAGTYSIAIDRVDGLFATAQDIILKDTSTGAETNLKAGPYSFAAEAGAFSSRFVLKYQKTLKVDAPAFNENTVSIFKNNGAIVVNSTVKNIKTIEVYDVRGRLIAKQKNVNSTSGRVNNVSEVRQVLIVKVSADDNNAVTKKVLN